MPSRPFVAGAVPLLIALLSLASAQSAYAHPHTYIDAELGLDLGPDGLEGLRVRFTPLYAFGEDIVSRYDVDGDGAFSSEETESVRIGAFEASAAYHYFIRVLIDGEEFRPERVERFSVESFKGRASLSFYVPCRVGAAEGRELEIFLKDETCYVSFALLYVDDGSCDGLDSRLDMYRDPFTYSHGSPLGAQRAVLNIRAGDGRRRAESVEGLAPATSVPPAPLETHANPFVRPGAGLDALPDGNPFFTVP